MTHPKEEVNQDQLQTVDAVAVLDLDRTLLRTTVVTNYLLDQLVHYGIDKVTVENAKSYVASQSGNSFDLFDYIDDTFSYEHRQLVVKRCLDELGDNSTIHEDKRKLFLYEGVDELIAALEYQRVPFVILTYGSQRYQDCKLEIIRRLLRRSEGEMPAIVTSSQNKADLILSEWFDQEGCLHGDARAALGYVRPNKMIIVDDKLSNLWSTSNQLLGILINNELPVIGESMTIAALAARMQGGESIRQSAREYSTSLNH